MFKMRFPQLPFITREMFAWGRTAELDIQVVSYCDSANVVTMIGVTREGIFKHPVTNNSAGAEEILTFRVPDIPTFLTLFTDDAFLERGDYYASVYLRANGERILKMCSGYVSKQSGINWPKTHDEAETEGDGVFKRIDVTAPAAGADFTEVIPANKQWKLLAAVGTLTTDANAANRRVHLTISPNSTPGARHIECLAADNQAASVARKYSFAPYGALAATADDDDILVPIPAEIIIVPTGRVMSDITNIQVGDQWSNVYLYVKEFIQD